MTSRTPIELVTRFLDALASGEVTTAMRDLGDDIVYTNVSLPTLRGRAVVERLFGRLQASPCAFNYRMLNISAADNVVLTERIDELRAGRFVLQFWVCGRYEVIDSQIVVWRDYFDYFDIAKAAVRALIGCVVPRVVHRLPAPAQSLTASISVDPDPFRGASE